MKVIESFKSTYFVNKRFHSFDVTAKINVHCMLGNKTCSTSEVCHKFQVILFNT